MYDILRAYLGRRTCPWCHADRYSRTWEWFYDHLPRRVHLAINSLGYDTWVGRVGGGHHRAHHLETT